MTTDPTTPTPRQLRAARQAVGMTRPDLAAEAGVHPKTLAAWELGAQLTDRPAVRRAVAALGHRGATFDGPRVVLDTSAADGATAGP